LATPSVGQKTARNRALGVLLLLFILSICIRLPNLNRPVSKHYEFNTAVVMINIMSWRQSGGGSRLYYTPVINYQHAGDKFPPNNLNIDKDGNTVYLSYGPGMFVLPYFFYQWFKLPAIPVYLQILNLILHLICIVLFFFLSEQLIPPKETGRYFMITAGCSFMILSPGTLWFLGNGYVNVGIMLPFVIGFFLLILPMLKNPSGIITSRLIPLAILIIILIYIDWYVLILCLVTGTFAVLKYRSNKKYGWLLLVLVLSVCFGTSLVFFQFASHMGSDAVINFWFHRFSERGLNLAGSTFLKKISYLFAYFLVSYLPLIILILISFINNLRNKFLSGWSEMEILFLKILSISLLFYNLILFEWSTDHEFAILPWSILLSFMAARLIGSFRKTMAYGIMGLFLILTVAQYYYINRPGLIARDGLAYDSFKKLGKSLSHIDPDYTICINLEQNPMVEYYAGRNILRAPDSLSVKTLLHELGIQKAVWVSQKNYQVELIQIIR
jgi:hypothetical protein